MIAFRYIRTVNIDQHIFGADIQIKAVGGYVSALYIPKNDAKKIKKMLFEYNQRKRGKGIIFG